MYPSPPKNHYRNFTKKETPTLPRTDLTKIFSNFLNFIKDLWIIIVLS